MICDPLAAGSVETKPAAFPSPTRVFPETPERPMPPRCSVLGVHREALIAAIDPETASTS